MDERPTDKEIVDFLAAEWGDSDLLYFLSCCARVKLPEDAYRHLQEVDDFRDAMAYVMERAKRAR